MSNDSVSETNSLQTKAFMNLSTNLFSKFRRGLAWSSSYILDEWVCFINVPCISIHFANKTIENKIHFPLFQRRHSNHRNFYKLGFLQIYMSLSDSTQERLQINGMIASVKGRQCYILKWALQMQKRQMSYYRPCIFDWPENKTKCKYMKL